MYQACVALGLITSPDPLGLPVAQAQQLRGLHLCQFLALHAHHNRQPIPFLPTHFQCLHVMAGIATATPPKRGHFYRVTMGTFSWSSDTWRRRILTEPQLLSKLPCVVWGLSVGL